MSTKALKRIVLPIIIFPILTTLSAKFLHSRIKYGLADALHAKCTGPDAPYALSYTGYPSIDPHLCGPVALFQETINDPKGLELLWYGLGTPALFLLPFLEATRSRKNLLLAFPVIWGLLCQGLTAAFTMSIYAPLFILTGSHLTPKKREDAKITRAHAESLIFALIIGYLVPSLGMLILKDPQVTAIWQVFPVIMSVASAAHLLARPPSRVSGSGWPLIQLLLIGLFIISSSLHFATIYPILEDPASFKALFVPSFDTLPASTSLGLLAIDFLKWDVIFSYTSLSLLTLWFANKTSQFIGLVLWYAFAIPMAGPGAAFIGALLWREAKLQ